PCAAVDSVVTVGPTTVATARTPPKTEPRSTASVVLSVSEEVLVVHRPSAIRHRRGIRALVLLVVVGLSASACGGDDDNGATGTTAAPITTTAPDKLPDDSDVTTGGTVIVGLEAEQSNW